MPVLEELQRLSDQRFLALYESLSEQGFGPLDGEVAKALRFRPQAIRKLPFDKRARKARSLIESRSNSDLCYELFGTYLVKNRKELVTGFLDATGVRHEDGMIHDIEAAEPDASKIDEAVKELDGRFDPEDVTLYLALCAEQWPRSEALRRAWSARRPG